MARVQFLAVRTTIRSKLLQGYTVKLIYDELCSEGKVTSSYKTFSRYIKIYEQNKINNNTKIEQEQITTDTQQAAEQRHHAELQKKKNFILENYNPIEDVKKEND